jgi:ribosomal protein L37AE/L43A
MKSKHSDKKEGSGIFRCQECGQECTQVEFHHGLNLCDHLALDAVALNLKKNREQRQGPEPISAIDEDQKAKAPHCPRCRGLMMNERYFDWEGNGDFEGWRCFSCGNVWDGVIADNQISVGKRMESQPLIRLPRHMVQPLSVRPMSGSHKASVRK